MNCSFASPEFDDAVAAVCHGSATEDQVRALNELLRSNPSARDEYLFRVELHSRLASNPDFYSRLEDTAAPLSTPLNAGTRGNRVSLNPVEPSRRRTGGRVLALAKKLGHRSLVTEGGHTWMNARHYLSETLQLYFQ